MNRTTSIFSLTILTSAFLLFLVQPMISKLLLPSLGGSPSVWNTAMVFFQAMLLLGYLYAYGLSRSLCLRAQVFTHLALVAFCLSVFLPITLGTHIQEVDVHSPVLWMVGVLLITVGYPFFLLSANASLLQHWFSKLEEDKNAYALYAASNTGSLVALLGYPLVVERSLHLGSQLGVWSTGYYIFAGLLLVCGIMTFRVGDICDAKLPAQIESSTAPRWRTRGYWLLLSFVPSSLLLGVTSYITTDIAAYPLFWVVPLAIYLLTFILAFLPAPKAIHNAILGLVCLAPLTALFMAFGITFITPLLLLHLFTFYAMALGCHGLLVRNKPDTHYLTEFYLWISVGGVLGGIFNVLIAPQLFSEMSEYPLIFMLAMFLLASRDRLKTITREDVAFGTIFCAILCVLLFVFGWFKDSAGYEVVNQWVGEHLPKAMGQEVSLMQLGAVFFFLLCMAAAYTARENSVRLALVVTSIFFSANLTNTSFQGGIYSRALYSERNFFGINRVVDSLDGTVRHLIHGTTLHGSQLQIPGQKNQMLSYYSRMSETYGHLIQIPGRRPLGLIGIGSGVLACLAGEGQEVDLFEIDPAVMEIAENPKLFTFLQDCPGTRTTYMGDGRLQISKQPNAHYGVIIVDAFSSDAIPIHLITKEAIALYFDKLAEDGILALHISNNHLDLAPVVATIAESLGYPALIQNDMAPQGKYLMPSVWVVMARKETYFNNLSKEVPGWHTLIPTRTLEMWTDDFSNILEVM